MQMKLIEKTENSIEIEFQHDGEAILNPLKELLLREEGVVSATVLKPHPVLANPRLFVEVSDGKPEQYVKNAAKSLRAHLDGLETQFLRETGA